MVSIDRQESLNTCMSAVNGLIVSTVDAVFSQTL